jgi:hypothetical protein
MNSALRELLINSTNKKNFGAFPSVVSALISHCTTDLNPKVKTKLTNYLYYNYILIPTACFRVQCNRRHQMYKTNFKNSILGSKYELYNVQIKTAEV